jgi:hypothetical protein
MTVSGHVTFAMPRKPTYSQCIGICREGSFTSLWLLKATVRMSASHPKATESLRTSETTLRANNRHRPSFRDLMMPSAILRPVAREL